MGYHQWCRQELVTVYTQSAVASLPNNLMPTSLDIFYIDRFVYMQVFQIHKRKVISFQVVRPFK